MELEAIASDRAVGIRDRPGCIEVHEPRQRVRIGAVGGLAVCLRGLAEAGGAGVLSVGVVLLESPRPFRRSNWDQIPHGSQTSWEEARNWSR
jgi:hypothetical protein